MNNPKCNIPLRIERMMLRLQGYNFDLKFTKSEENISDYTSRHPLETVQKNSSVEHYINFVTKYATPNAISIEDVKIETKRDTLLQTVATLIRKNDWYKLDKPDKFTELNKADITQLKQYRKIKNDLTVNDDDSLILKGNRIVLPRPYHAIAVKLAHVGHLGIEKTKALLRSKIYFVGMDRLVEKEIIDCASCQTIGNGKPPAPLYIMPLPQEVWEQLNMDYLGPFPNGHYMFVIIDQRSKFPEAEFLTSTSAEQLIPSLQRIFSTYGLPKTVISDNGPPFKSHALKTYFQQKNVSHRRITPLWPQANAQAERFMKSLNKIVKSAYIEGKPWKNQVYEFLFAYRNTPHCTTQVAPADLMFQRKLQHTLPTISKEINPQMNDIVDQRDRKRKEAAKEYTDYRRHAKDRTFEKGDRVIIKQQKKNKLSPLFQLHNHIKL